MNVAGKTTKDGVDLNTWEGTEEKEQAMGDRWLR